MNDINPFQIRHITINHSRTSETPHISHPPPRTSLYTTIVHATRKASSSTYISAPSNSANSAIFPSNMRLRVGTRVNSRVHIRDYTEIKANDIVQPKGGQRTRRIGMNRKERERGGEARYEVTRRIFPRLPTSPNSRRLSFLGKHRRRRSDNVRGISTMAANKGRLSTERA